MTENTAIKQRGRPFKPGQSGNPQGKPAGARNASLVALDAIGTDAAAEIVASVVQAAKAGDMRAADILLRRLWPERKGRPVLLDLPHMTSAADIADGVAAVATAMAVGEISPEEAQTVAT